MAATGAELAATGAERQRVNFKRVNSCITLRHRIRRKNNPKEGEVPILVAIQEGKAHALLNNQLQHLLDVMHHDPDLNLAAAYMLSGKKAEARAVVQDILKAVPHYNVQAAIRGAPYKRPEDLKLYLDTIRAAGLPEK